MIYELRTYQVVPGKMQELNKRFGDLTIHLFQKHVLALVTHRQEHRHVPRRDLQDEMEECRDY